MRRDYSNSRIYQIVDRTTGETYIGSTTLSLEGRLMYHKRDYMLFLEGLHPYITSFKILKDDNYDMSVIDEVSCETKRELCAIERKHIEAHPKCVNKYIPTRTSIAVITVSTSMSKQNLTEMLTKMSSTIRVANTTRSKAGKSMREKRQTLRKRLEQMREYSRARRTKQLLSTAL